MTEDNYSDCERLGFANFATVFQSAASALFYLGTEISNQHLSREDKIALRNNIDAGYVIRWVCSQTYKLSKSHY